MRGKENNKFIEKEKSWRIAYCKPAGFTLIELLAASAIILLMAVVAVPSYSKYSARAEFFQKTDELKEALDQTRIFAQHPEADFDHYEVDVDMANAKATFKKIRLTDGASGSLPFTVIKTIQFPSGTTITGVTGSIFQSSRYYECDASVSNCCLFVDHENWKCDKSLHPSPGITNQMDDGDWLLISNSSLSLSRKISVKNHMIVMVDL